MCTHNASFGENVRLKSAKKNAEPDAIGEGWVHWLPGQYEACRRRRPR
jgi:hypothetical protein